MDEEPTSPTDYLQSLYDEVKENIDYIVDVEGIEIPEVWQDRILAPLAFAVAFWSNEEATGSPKPVKSNGRTTDPARASSEPEGKPNE